MKKKSYLRTIIVVFVTVYICGMVLATALVAERFQRVYSNDFDTRLDIISRNFQRISDEVWDEADELTTRFKNNMNYIATDMGFYSEEQRYQQYSVAVYTAEGEKIAQTTNMLHIFAGMDGYYFRLEDYFSDEEMELFIKWQKDRMTVYSVLSSAPPVWRIHAYVNEETAELAKLYVTNEYDKEITEEDYNTPNTDLKWSWINPDEAVQENLIPTGDSTHVSYRLYIPYLEMGEEYHEKWLETDFLQDFPKEWNEYTSGAEHDENLFSQKTDYVFTLSHPNALDAEETYIFKVREVTYNWQAAMDYMKEIYVFSFLFVVVCVVIIIHSSNKYDKQRAILEATRRDFTNAIAHELKTPLGVIRGFAENSLENTVEEKREYYLRQIISQTEEMDKLVKEMIYISKLDSEEMKLKKETLSVKEIVREQLSKLQPLVEERNLEVRFQILNDFQVEGDKQYLERAIWNVLSNAIEYNRQDGFINILIDVNECKIENSGKPIEEDDLPHVFDMFYTGDKSRKTTDKHMGLGLYLAKKILELHNLNITIKNSEVGVEVTVN